MCRLRESDFSILSGSGVHLCELLLTIDDGFIEDGLYFIDVAHGQLSRAKLKLII